MDIKNKRLDNNSTGEKYFVLLFGLLCSCSFVVEQEHKWTGDLAGVWDDRFKIWTIVGTVVLLFNGMIFQRLKK